MTLTDREKAWLRAANEFSPPYEELDLNAPHTMLGPDKGDANYAWQDGWIYAWSDSNIGYLHCWWLDTLGELYQPATPLMQALSRDKPFDPDWLREVIPGSQLEES